MPQVWVVPQRLATSLWPSRHFAGAVALRGVEAAEIVNRGWSDRQDQLIEGSRDPQGYCVLGSKFVVAAADVLDEGVPGGDYSCAAGGF